MSSCSFLPLQTDSVEACGPWDYYSIDKTVLMALNSTEVAGIRRKRGKVGSNYGELRQGMNADLRFDGQITATELQLFVSH